MTLATPKSSTLSFEVPWACATKMFDGLRSRWTTPWVCAKAIASATGSSSRTTSCSDRPRSLRCRRARSSSESVYPSSHSRTMYGHQRAGRGRHGGARRDGARDVQRAARQPVVDLALVAKAANERLYERRAQLVLQLETLDGNRFVEPNVLRSVDDAEPAFPDRAVDAKLAVEHLANEAVKIRCCHGRLYTDRKLEGASRAPGARSS